MPGLAGSFLDKASKCQFYVKLSRKCQKGPGSLLPRHLVSLQIWCIHLAPLHIWCVHLDQSIHPLLEGGPKATLNQSELQNELHRLKYLERQGDYPQYPAGLWLIQEINYCHFLDSCCHFSASVHITENKCNRLRVPLNPANRTYESPIIDPNGT